MRESDIAYSSGLKFQYTTASTQSCTPVVTRKLTSFDSLLSADVKERTCVLCGGHSGHNYATYRTAPSQRRVAGSHVKPSLWAGSKDSGCLLGCRVDGSLWSYVYG